MKKYIYSVVFFAFCINLYSQSIYFSKPIQYVEIGNLGITGHQLTLESLISINIDTALQIPILSKHEHPGNCNYYFKPTGAGITTTTGFYFVVNPEFLEKKFKINYCYHVAITYDGEKLKYLINGCVVDEVSAHGELIQNNLFTRIGQYAAFLYDTNQYYGYINELRIWNVARSEDEIKINMNDLLNPQSQPGLLAYYKFESANPYKNIQGDTRWDGTPYGSPDIENNPYCTTPIIPFELTKVDSMDETNFNAKDGKIIIHVNNPDNVTYSLDGKNYQTNNEFDGLSHGNYIAYAKFGDCIKTIATKINSGKLSLTIFIPDTTAIVGTKNFHIPILIKSNSSNQILSLKKYSTEILINKYCFLPENIVTGIFNTYYDGENSVIKIDGILDNYKSGYKIINEIVGTVLMGDSINPIIIKTFDFEDKGLKIDTIKNGSLTIKACAKSYSKIKNLQIPELNIIPNPINDYCEIQFTNFEDYQYNISMYNILGNKLFAKDVNPNRENLILNFNQYNSGIYFIAVTLNNQMILNKLLIK